jgi:hypothetical protein
MLGMFPVRGVVGKINPTEGRVQSIPNRGRSVIGHGCTRQVSMAASSVARRSRKKANLHHCVKEQWAIGMLCFNGHVVPVIVVVIVVFGVVSCSNSIENVNVTGGCILQPPI